MALSVGSRLPGITWHFALWSPDFPPPPNFHRGQRLSNRLSAAKINGTKRIGQALKAVKGAQPPIRKRPARRQNIKNTLWATEHTGLSIHFLLLKCHLVEHVLALAGNFSGQRCRTLEGHFLEQEIKNTHGFAADCLFAFRGGPTSH